MKRTNRDKDWPFITALGLKLLRNDDPRGCLHIFDAETLRNAVVIHPPSAWMQDARPTLRAALEKSFRSLSWKKFSSPSKPRKE